MAYLKPDKLKGIPGQAPVISTSENYAEKVAKTLDPLYGINQEPITLSDVVKCGELILRIV